MSILDTYLILLLRLSVTLKYFEFTIVLYSVKNIIQMLPVSLMHLSSSLHS